MGVGGLDAALRLGVPYPPIFPRLYPHGPGIDTLPPACSPLFL